jgi:hypothetical protein
MSEAGSSILSLSKQKKSSSEPAWLTTAFEVPVFAGAATVKSRSVSRATYTNGAVKTIVNKSLGVLPRASVNGARRER